MPPIVMVACTWRKMMKRRYKFDDYEVNIIIRALIDMRNQLIAVGRYTDAVDELLSKMVD